MTIRSIVNTTAPMDNIPNRITDARELLEWLHGAMPARLADLSEELRDGLDAKDDMDNVVAKYWPPEGTWSADAILERLSGVAEDIEERFDTNLWEDGGVEAVQAVLATAAADRVRVARLEAILVAFGAYAMDDGPEYALDVLAVLLPPFHVPA